MHKALITGTSRGIGKAIKTIFEKNGVFVYHPNRAEMDLSSIKSVENYMKRIDDVDILINCAGLNNLSELKNINEEKIQEMLNVNLLSQTFLIKAAAEYMKKQKYGKILNFSSIWSEFSKEKRIMYSIAKSGVNGLTRAAAVELAPYNILVNAIAPGFVDTEMTSINNTKEQIEKIKEHIPLNRLAKPEEIAEFAYFLTSEKNTFITGQTIFVDGGFSCV